MSDIRNVILQRTFASLLDVPVMSNVVRGDFAENMVAVALGGGWSTTSTWASWDIQHVDGWKVEVKQSSLLQSWHTKGDQRLARALPRFDIASRDWYWSGAEQVRRQGRIADLYVFASHTETTSLADQREPSQWMFYVMPERQLPAQKGISLSRLGRMTTGVGFSQLKARVETTIETLDHPKPL